MYFTRETGTRDKEDMERFRIIIIEDDERVSEFLKMELTHEGYSVSFACDGVSGLDLIKKEEADLIILDLMLPGMSGIEVCKRARRFTKTHILMLTAKSDVTDIVHGLDIGADDYLTKPFRLEELLARIRVVVRKNNPETRVLGAYDLTMDTESRQVARAGNSIELTKKEFDILEILLANKNRVLTKETLLDKVWGYDYVSDYNTVEVFIRHLRAKIDDRHETKIITTVRGVGYTIKEE